MVVRNGYISGLGLVPTGKRKVSPVPRRLLNLVPKPSDNNVTVKESGADSINDTVPLIRNKVRRTLYQTKDLAPELKKSSLSSTVRSDWEFIFKHIQYVPDPSNDEQVRSPRRLIYEGKGDCDCFTVTLSSLLLNQGIPHKLRVSANKVADEWGHIYIVVPKDGNVNKELANRTDYIVLDPVVHQFDYEAPFVTKKDFAMKLTYLDGFGCPDTPGCNNEVPVIKRLRRYVYTDQVKQAGLIPTRQFLKSNNIPFTEIVDEQTNTGAFAVQTASGAKKVPTIMTPTQAEQLKAMVAGMPVTSTPLPANGNTGIVPPGSSSGSSVSTQQGTSTSQGTQANPCGKPFPWWWLAAGGAVLGAVLFGGKKPGLNGVPMNGPVKRSPKPRKKKKNKTIHI